MGVSNSLMNSVDWPCETATFSLTSLNMIFVIFFIEPPVFVRPFGSAELVKGSDIFLEGTVSGSPPFEVSCLLNDKLIRSDKEHKISVENNTVTLQIYNCDTRDAGTYQCSVTNDVGETSCSCQISLKGQLKDGVKYCHSR